ncbi:B3 domain-containing protein At5g60140 [Nicotiana tabacum]|uniref:B3 domain-containing protein At5g60140 n=1 Tax=Nicotiana tabacum TaxID=4097 RepID=A0A1S4CJ09_TOBAC|nr:B3 domain-containing protein At5g60140-like [Nicotiana tomentosiformis]XP_016501190.1 PREDICTED: B3 domain-containing protein At5g60140-like [Nicotiana tabacum]
MDDAKKMEKGFFKFFYPENSSQKLKIPTAFTEYKNGKLPKRISLRDRFGNVWPIELAKKGRDLYFQDGWVKFIEDNSLEFGDFLIFDYDGSGVFDFKLLGKTACEKKGAGVAVKVEEEEMINIAHRKSEKPKGKKYLASDSISSSSSSYGDEDEEYMVEEEQEDEEEEYEEETNGKAIVICKKKAPCSKGSYVEEEKEDDDEDEEEEYEEDEEETEEEEKNNEKARMLKKKALCSKGVFKRATTIKRRDVPDQYGAEIFRSGRATQPKNPYFVAKIRAKRRDQLYVPVDVVRDYNLELPPKMFFRDSEGRKFETEVNIWKDGRIWLKKGWRKICRWNLVEKEDRCICEFMRGKANEVLYLQVTLVKAGGVSNPVK